MNEIDIWQVIGAIDLNNITHEWMLIALLCFALSVGLAIAWVTKFKEAEKLKDELELQLANLEGVKAALDEKQKHEIDILNTVQANTEKIAALEIENGKYKDADSLRESLVDKYIVPVNGRSYVNMTEGAYAYFVDEDKKREFALESSKREIINGIVDILCKEDYIRWENVYDPLNERYTVKGKLLILADKKTVQGPMEG